MKTVFRLTIASVALAIAFIAFPARSFAATTPQEMHISCTAPNPDHQTGLHRPKGDGNAWTFQIVLDGDARFVDGPYWTYPGKSGTDPDWGLWMGGDDGDSSLGWSSPGKTGEFQVSVKGKITCGDGGGGGGEPIDFSAGWDGKVEFNAEIKVRRKDSGDDYSSSATVAAGSKSTSEHQADVEVIATDDEGNPMPNVTVDTPTIQNGDGSVPAGNASISAVDATTNSEGKAFFTFTSSDTVGTVTLEEDGGESTASASIEQDWTQLKNKTQKEDIHDENDWSWKFDEYFDYDVSSNITFRLSLTGDDSVPIKEHDIEYVTTAVSGWVWDSQTGEYVPTNGAQDYSTIAAQYGNLVTYGNLSSTSGDYTRPQTIHTNSGFQVSTVYFKAEDYNAY